MHDQEHAPRRRSIVTPYITGWAILALGAMGYIGWVATHADEIAASRPAPSTPAAPSGETNEGQRAMSDALAEVRALKDTVGEVQRDMAQLKTEVASVGDKSDRLVTRIAALEELPGKGKSTTAAAPPAPIVQKAAALPSPVPAPVAADDFKPATVLPKVINAAPEAKAPEPKIQEPKSLETGSVAASAVAQAPIVFGPAVVKPAPKPVGIQIATGPSVDSLRLSWSLLTDRHADTLKNLQPRYASAGNASGDAFDLVAGPLKSAAEAKRVCAALAAKDVPCKVGDYKGDAL